MRNAMNKKPDAAAEQDMLPGASYDQNILPDNARAADELAIGTMKDAIHLYRAAYRRIIREHLLAGCQDVIENKVTAEETDPDSS